MFPVTAERSCESLWVCVMLKFHFEFTDAAVKLLPRPALTERVNVRRCLAVLPTRSHLLGRNWVGVN